MCNLFFRCFLEGKNYPKMKVLRILPILFFLFLQVASAQFVWPGDVNNNGIVNEVDLLALGKAFGQSGPARPDTTSIWGGQTLPEQWEGRFPNGLSYAYADCDGNGRINLEDVKVLEANLRRSHGDVPFVPDEILPGLAGVSPSFELLSKDLNINPGKEKEIALGLGNMNIPVDSIAGLSFLIKLDPSLYNVQATDFNFSGWLGEGGDREGVATITKTITAGRSAPGDFLVAFTITNGVPLSSIGNGQIGTIIISPNEFITELDLSNLRISIDSITMVDENLNPIPVLGIDFTPEVADSLLPNFTLINGTMCNGDSLTFNNQEIGMQGIYRDTMTNQYGLDSFIILNLALADTFHTEITEMICESQSIFFNNEDRSIAGSYRDTLTAQNGCDSFVVLNLAVNPMLATTLTQSICQGEQYTFNGRNLTTTGTYFDTLTTSNGCDSLITLELTEIINLQTTLRESICVGSSRFFNGQTLTTAGIYQETLIASNGCDSSVVLDLKVRDFAQTNLTQNICVGNSHLFNGRNLTVSGIYQDTFVASGGCDSIVVLDLTVSNFDQTNLTTTLCEGGNILFNGQNLTATGIYRDTLANSNGCDSFVVLDFRVLDVYESQSTQTICAGEQTIFQGNLLTTTGIYQDTMQTVSGCDSILILDLTVKDTFYTDFDVRICGGSINFNNQNLTTSGVYQDTLSSSTGCDSFVVLNLFVEEVFTTNLTETICEGASYLFNNLTLNNTGTYAVNLISDNGCDSMVTLNLTVGTTQNTALQETICNGETKVFNNQVLNTSGIYFDTLSTVHGCDSFIALNLTVLPDFEDVTEQVICAGDTLNFFNFVLTTTNSYMVILQTETGCDSVVIMNLLVLGDLESTVESTICATENLNFGNQLLTDAGTYMETFTSDRGCDSLVTLNLSVVAAKESTMDSTICAGESMLFGNDNLTETGMYTQMLTSDSGCDSMVILTLTVDTLGQGNCAMSVGIEEERLASIEIYPNPVKERLLINSARVKMNTIQLVNITGQIVSTQTFSKGNAPIQAEVNMQDVEAGVYWVLIQTEFGLRQEKVVKF